MTTVLALDTTSKQASAAILSDGEIRIEYNFTSQGHMSALLIPTLDRIMNSSGVTLDDIDVIGITTGPGLFTGIRVGLATVKGLLVSKPKPVVPIDALEALAFKYFHGRSKPEDIVVPMIDARRSEVYIAAYKTSDETPLASPLEMIPPQLIRIDETADVLKDLEKFILTGSGASVHREFLETELNHPKMVFRSDFLAAETGRLALTRFQNGSADTDLSTLAPLYIRKPDAEQNLINARQTENNQNPS